MSMTATAQWAALPDHSAEIARVREEFITAYGYEPDGVWSAPGRLNLLGEYIDFWVARVCRCRCRIARILRVRCVVMVYCVLRRCRCRGRAHGCDSRYSAGASQGLVHLCGGCCVGDESGGWQGYHAAR